jgi:hypothetical protein
MELMALSGIPLDQLDKADLEALIENAVSEGRTLEFKQAIGTDDRAKREFLADVTSFANAAGGDMLIGVAERAGVAASLVGLPTDTRDPEIMRLENLIRDGVDPRIPGIQTGAIELEGGSVVLVVRIPRSWAAPHMVTLKGLSRFYSRTSAGKYQLDASEIRAAFVASESARTFLRSFRLDRLGRLIANEGPVSLLENPKTVLHIVPLAASDPSVRFDVAELAERHSSNFRPLYGGSWYTRINADGALAFASDPGGRRAVSYTQVFRSGSIEAVEALLLRRKDQGDDHAIPSLALERTLISALELNLALLAEVGVPAPYALALSFLGVRGLEMAVDVRRFERRYPIDRDDLLIPETLIEDPGQEPDRLLKPHLDALWNATGHPGSLNYDERGRWHDRR